MRIVASYRLTLSAATPDDVHQVYDDAVDKRNRWLRSKGTIDTASTPPRLKLPDGRVAEYKEESVAFESLRLNSCEITEPAGAGQFRTAIDVSRDDSTAELACQLAVRGVPSRIGPVRFDAKCPNVVHRIVSANVGWAAGGVPLSLHPQNYVGAYGGRGLCSLIWSKTRHLPIIVVSDHEGLILHPTLPARLAWDLCGLALVATTDGAASWEVTRKRGREWSCYHGAVRVYWPMSDVVGNAPEMHPLWTPQKLLHGVSGTLAAVARLRRQLRRRVFGLSTFAHPHRTLGDTIRKEARERQLGQLRRAAEETGEWEALATEYARESEDKGDRLEEAEAEIMDLKVQLSNLQQSLQWKHTGGEEVSPDDSVPPITVTEALEQAREKHDAYLLFGNDVDRGIRGLSDDAGPPAKILRYLDGLSEMTKERLQGNLGNQPVSWLKERGFAASGEGEVVRNSRIAMEARTWNDGRSSREFTLHMKPAEATSPDRCVRIYFDFDEELRKTVVAWIGRHP